MRCTEGVPSFSDAALALMAGPTPSEVTQLLKKATGGSGQALDDLFPLVYDELRRLARFQLRGEEERHTLQATALVHEAYMRLVDRTCLEVRDRAHFFALASKVIRRLLVDYYRRRRADKRGGNRLRVTIDKAVSPFAAPSVDILALDEALEKLARLDERKSRVVELRFFGGLSVEEAAAVLGVSDRTIEGDWFFARAWLKKELEKSD